MKLVTNPDRQRRAGRQFDTLFRALDPYSEPFNVTASARLLLYPIEGFFLDEQQFRAIADASLENGDATGFLVPALSWEGQAEWDKRTMWELDLNNPTVSYYGGPENDPFVWITAMFGSNGGWGVVTSDEEFALVGGDEQVVAKIVARLPEHPTEMIDQLIEDVDDLYERLGIKTEWLFKVLQHVVGSARAREYLKNHDGAPC
jgi:hypothetical protein